MQRGSPYSKYTADRSPARGPRGRRDQAVQKFPRPCRQTIERDTLNHSHWSPWQRTPAHSPAGWDARRIGKDSLGNVHRVWTTPFSVERAFLQLTLPDL